MAASAVRAQVRGAGIVIVAGDAGRESRRGIVVQDQGLAGELREVHDHIRAFRRSQQKRVLVHVADIEAGRVGDPGGDLLAVDHDRGREETAFGADLDPIRTWQS